MGKGRVLTLFGVALLGACSSRGTEEVVGEAQQALTTCAPGTPCELSFSLGKGVKTTDVALVASDSAFLGDRSVVQRSDGQPGAVGAMGTKAEIGASARVGSVSTRGEAVLRSNSVVSNKLVAARVTRQTPVTAPATFTVPSGDPAKISWNVTFPTAHNGEVRLDPDKTRELTPGRYTTVIVNARATLKLKPGGAYYFDSFTVEPTAKVLADSSQGTAVIYVRDGMSIKGSVSATTRTGDLLIGCFTSDAIFVESELDATIIAPKSELTIGPLNGTVGRYDGSYFARVLRLRPDVVVRRTALSNTGPGIATVTVNYQGGANTVAPPAPSPAGKTVDGYKTAVLGYLEQLYNEGYDGPTKQIGPHPSATGNQPVSQLTHTLDPNPVPSPAAGSYAATVPAGKPQIVTEFPRLDPTYQDPAGPDAEKTCPLGMGPGLPDPTQHTGPNPPPAAKPFFAGDPRDANADFDAYFELKGETHYGVSDAQGFYAGMSGSFLAGIRVLGLEQEFIGANLDGDANTKQEPRLKANAELRVLGEKMESWSYSQQDPSFKADLCGSLCSTPKPLLPHPIEFPVGPVTISIDAALEGEVPANLSMTETGPAFTVSPMLRAYVTVGGYVGVGLQLGVEGQLDVLRVDVPLDARLNWSFDNSPEVCAANINLDTGVKFRFSTLNGQLFLVMRVDAIVGTVELARWKILGFDGLVYETPRAKLVDVDMKIPLPENVCTVERASCGGVAPDAVATHFSEYTSEIGYAQQQFVTSDYNFPERSTCQDHYVVEMPKAQLNGDYLSVYTRSEGRTPTDPVECPKLKGSATMLATTDGTTWTSEDYFQWEGYVTPEGTCNTVKRFPKHAPLAELTPFPDDPVLTTKIDRSWKAVRIVAHSTLDCEPQPVRIIIGEHYRRDE